MTAIAILAWILLSNEYDINIYEHALIAISVCIAFTYDILNLAVKLINKKKDE